MPKYHLKTLLKVPSDKLLMNLWQEVVKKRAGYKCEYPDCRKTEYLNAHHFFSRSRAATKYDPDNGLSLCAEHHSLGNRSAHKDPLFKDVIITYGVRDDKWLEILQRRAFTPMKIDRNLIKLDLENELKRL